MSIKEKAYPDLVEILTQENEDLKNKFKIEVLPQFFYPKFSRKAYNDWDTIDQ